MMITTWTKTKVKEKKLNLFQKQKKNQIMLINSIENNFS